MILYHGSYLAIENPLILRTNIGRDFGPAFYVTDIQEQAERWAIRKTRILNQRGQTDCAPTISVYQFDAEQARNSLNWVDFPTADLGWLEMILSCRQNSGFSHGYDIVSGKIADDSVGATVTYVMRGIMRKEDALEQLKFQKINSQIAFCTQRVLSFLTFQECYYLEG